MTGARTPVEGLGCDPGQGEAEAGVRVKVGDTKDGANNGVTERGGGKLGLISNSFLGWTTHGHGI